MITNTVEKFVHIRSSIFPILPDENPESYEDFHYGKSVCLFLQDQLPTYGFTVDRFVDEDWGGGFPLNIPLKILNLAYIDSPTKTRANLRSGSIIESQIFSV